MQELVATIQTIKIDLREEDIVSTLGTDSVYREFSLGLLISIKVDFSASGWGIHNLVDGFWLYND